MGEFGAVSVVFIGVLTLLTVLWRLSGTAQNVLSILERFSGEIGDRKRDKVAMRSYSPMSADRLSADRLDRTMLLRVATFLSVLVLFKQGNGGSRKE